MSKPVLYFSPGTRASRVYWLILELGIDVEIRPIRLDAGEHKKPEYTKLNPAGEVPTYVDGDLVLTDSSAIILHLLDKHDQDGKWGGKLGSSQRAHLYRWALYCASRVDDTVILYFLHKSFLPEAVRDVRLADAKAKEFAERAAPVFLAGLGSHHYFGENHHEFTADDVVVGFILATALRAGLLEDAKLASLKEYAARVASRPHFGKSFTLPK